MKSSITLILILALAFVVQFACGNGPDMDQEIETLALSIDRIEDDLEWLIGDESASSSPDEQDMVGHIIHTTERALHIIRVHRAQVKQICSIARGDSTGKLAPYIFAIENYHSEFHLLRKRVERDLLASVEKCDVIKNAAAREKVEQIVESSRKCGDLLTRIEEMLVEEAPAT